jgi:hypothetical protein
MGVEYANGVGVKSADFGTPPAQGVNGSKDEMFAIRTLFSDHARGRREPCTPGTPVNKVARHDFLRRATPDVDAHQSLFTSICCYVQNLGAVGRQSGGPTPEVMVVPKPDP